MGPKSYFERSYSDYLRKLSGGSSGLESFVMAKGRLSRITMGTSCECGCECECGCACDCACQCDCGCGCACDLKPEA